MSQSRSPDMKNRYTTGHVDPWWPDDFRLLDYQLPDLTNAHDIENWNSMGYGGFRYGGAIFNMQNRMPDWAASFLTLFQWQNTAIQFFLLRTMWAVPPHSDGYPGYMRRTGIQDINKICRAVVFLEDWCSGHYLEVDGDLIAPWRAGDWVSWRGEVPHFAANIGHQDRFSLQITGICE